MQTALRTIEKLQQYRPKRQTHRAQKSSFGRSTPVFSALLTPAHEKGDFFSRSRASTPGGSRPGSRSASPDVGYRGDVDDLLVLPSYDHSRASTSSDASTMC